MNAIRTFSRILDAVLSAVTVAFLAATVALVVAAVFMRYVMSEPLTYSYDLATLLFAWIVFMGLAVAEHDGAHLAVDLSPSVLTTRGVRWLAVVRQLVSLALTVFLAWIGWKLLSRAGMQLPSLTISIKWLYASLPLGFGLMALAQLVNFAEFLAGGRGDRA